jgi:hypothetical protein
MDLKFFEVPPAISRTGDLPCGDSRRHANVFARQHKGMPACEPSL